MPHLSPLKWALALASLWLTQFIIQANTWWDTPTTFNTPVTQSKNSNSLLSWQWLQDGR